MKITHNIGSIAEPLLVFGGVYSNLQALKKMRELAEERGIAPSRIICTGDVVGYCADPEATVRFMRDWGVHVVAGNVELQLRDGEQDCGCDFKEGSRCDVFSRQWYPYAQEQLSAESIQWMHTLPDFIRFEWNGMRGLALHGSYFETAGYVFGSTHWMEKERNFEAADAELILAGHSGLPFSTVQDSKTWLNAGVIGMPANDGTPRVWYATLEMDHESPFVQHHQFSYDHEEASRLMTANYLPPEYALTLKTGLWDNNEILPPEETSKQGQRILLDSKRVVLPEPLLVPVKH